MGTLIRQAEPKDAAAWLDLLKACVGDDYPARQVYESGWITQELTLPHGCETHVAEVNGKLMAAISILPVSLPNRNPVANLGRDLFRPEALADGLASTLLEKVVALAEQRGQALVSRVFASDNDRQRVFEQRGFACTGFQPFKHMLRTREGVLFYMHLLSKATYAPTAVSESLAQVTELAGVAVANLKLPAPTPLRDGVTGYPLQTEVEFEEVSFADFKSGQAKCESLNPPVEISGGFHLGWGLLRVATGAPFRALVAKRGGKLAGGLAYSVDEHDRCVRLVEGFSADDLTGGALCQRLVKMAQERFNAVYVEVDVVMTAPRLLKSLEQLGFVPVAFFPGVFARGKDHADVVKLVKLNMAYGLENANLTSQTRAVAGAVDRNFQDQKVGVAVINLLRGLPIFEGLGDGELRKISRLFTQKLYRPADKVFNKGDSGHEAYVIMRGQVDILLEEQGRPIASFGNGQIFGEMAFLDGAPRAAMALAAQPSILLVIQRVAFNEMVQREPHLGMVVMRNVAMELANRLRRSNPPAGAAKK